MPEKITPQLSPDAIISAGTAPEKSGEPQDIETAAEQIIVATDAAVTGFEHEQQRLLQTAEQEASAGPTPVSLEELSEIKQQSGITKVLQTIGDKVRTMRDHLKEAAMDRKIERFIKKEWRDSDTGISFGQGWVQEFIKNLTIEQIERHPKIIEAAKKNFLWHIKELAAGSPLSVINSDYGRNHQLSHHLRSLQEIKELLRSHQPFMDALINQSEVPSLQDEIFRKCLYEICSQPYATVVRDSIFMDPARAQHMAIEALTQTIATGNQYHSVYYFARTFSDFNIDQTTRFDLVLKKFKALTESTYPYNLTASRLCKDFGLNEQDLQEFLNTYRPTLEQYCYDASLKSLTDNGHGVMGGLWEHFKREFDFQLNTEDMKRQPNMREKVRIAILANTRRAGLTEQKNYEFFQALSPEPLEDILQSPEGQRALYRGASYLVSTGKNSATINGYLTHFNLNLETFRSDPETLNELRDLIESDIRGKMNFWRDEIIDFLQIPNEKLQDLKTRMVANLIDLQEYWRAFELIDSTTFNSEEQKIISQEIFKAADQFLYLIRVRDIWKANKNLPKPVLTTLINQHERFVKKTDQQIGSFITIVQKIADSPSQEIVKIKDQLMEQILMTENPEQTYEIIHNIFIQNNVPLVGKIQKIFNSLFPDSALADRLTAKSSPVLVHASPRTRRNIIFQDLLRIHIDSGNPSLKTFLQLFQQAEPLINKLDTNDKLSDAEQQKLAYVFKKFKTLVDVSQRGRTAQFPALDINSLNQSYQELRQQLGVKAGQTMSQRVVEMFARPLGYNTINEILSQMSWARQTSDQRSRQLAQEKMEIRPSDLIKGVNIQYIDTILQNGAVAPEYLGASSGSDSTPFDADLELINDKDQITIASSYGEIYFVIKNRGQFQISERNKTQKYDKTKWELFQIDNSQHHGVRTGFPCTEVNFIILKNNINEKAIENLFYSIAQNGYYIPILDANQQLVFTPEMYDEYRRYFAGIERFNGENLSFASSKSEKYYPELKAILAEKEKDNERLSKLKEEIRTMVLSILAQLNIHLKPEYDDSLIGAELLDIGSTGRDTNAVGEGDFDFNLKLDSKYFDRFPEIAQEIAQRLGGEPRGKTESPILPSSANHFQFRFFGTNVFGQKDVDIDIGFVKKSDLNVYASHDAVADKLANIRQAYGEEAYQETVANVLLAKKWLKAGEAYKKGNYGQGGLGGIGVENLILAYGGNIKSAFRAFAETAKNPDGSIKDFELFKDDFKLLDAGMDLRSNHHDNFVYNMNATGYQKMLDVIQKHFGNF